VPRLKKPDRRFNFSCPLFCFLHDQRSAEVAKIPLIDFVHGEFEFSIQLDVSQLGNTCSSSQVNKYYSTHSKETEPQQATGIQRRNQIKAAVAKGAVFFRIFGAKRENIYISLYCTSNA
jgi:hypothetical protein